MNRPTTHLLDTRRPRGLDGGGTQIPVACSRDIINATQGGARATADVAAITCRECRAILADNRDVR